MAPLTIQQAFDQALQHHQANRLPEAEQLYRQILAQQPDHADAMHLLGVIANQVGKNDAAVDLIRRSIALKPNVAEAYHNLGNAMKDQGNLRDAAAAYRRAIALRFNYPEAHNNLGIVLKDDGQPDDAIAEFRQTISLRPNYAEAHNNLGNALKDKAQLDDAIAAYRQAIALNPNIAEAYHNLGDALKSRGQLDDAIAACRKAIALKPSSPDAHHNIAMTLQAKGQLDEAIDEYRQAISLRPDYMESRNNLGTALKEKGLLDESIAVYRQIIDLKPESAPAHNNLGSALADAGQLQEALAAYRQALVLKPSYSEAHSNIVFTMLYDPAGDSRAIAEELRRWNEQHAEPLKSSIPIHTNDRMPDRRIRVGYVSSDFRDHVVGRNLLPLFHHHDHRQVEITCYAQIPRPDATTKRFQQIADRWRSIVGLSHEQVASLIREDRIDILVDLSLHTAGNRLPVFARKPAPIQVTFAGYPGSTGLGAIDYRLSDPHLDPPEIDESIYSEQTIRLPDTFWCYDPMEAREIPVNTSPAEMNGFITFGCLNNFCKINDQILALWARVIRQVDNSRLLLLAHEGSHRQRTLDRLSQEGIDPMRVEFVPYQPRREYLQLYHRIDIGLDSFPYNGHTTSLDSFWMGVPVVTLVGDRIVSRAGWSQLSNLGLTELAGHKEEQFVQIAVELAKDLPRLAELRSTLRNRMEQSPLTDAAKFACGIEAAYRQMWHAWIK